MGFFRENATGVTIIWCQFYRGLNLGHIFHWGGISPGHEDFSLMKLIPDEYFFLTNLYDPKKQKKRCVCYYSRKNFIFMIIGTK